MHTTDAHCVFDQINTFGTVGLVQGGSLAYLAVYRSVCRDWSLDSFEYEAMELGNVRFGTL